MTTPKRKSSKSKTRLRKRIWKNKASKMALNARNWAKLLLRNLQKI
nr:ribosomal protein L32 [Ostreobium quekettii]